MANAGYKASKSAGKCGKPPTTPDQWSPNVFAEGLNVIRKSDKWVEHCTTDCHIPTQAGGSATVFVNGLPLARVGDELDCGDEIANGAGTVHAG